MKHGQLRVCEPYMALSQFLDDVLPNYEGKARKQYRPAFVRGEKALQGCERRPQNFIFLLKRVGNRRGEWHEPTHGSTARGQRSFDCVHVRSIEHKIRQPLTPDF